MLRQALLALSRSRRLQRLATRNRVARRAARRFVAGETLADALAAVADVNARGLVAALDYLGENTTVPAEADASAAVYLRAVEAIAARGARSHVSLKLTQMGLDLDEADTERRVARIADAAAQPGTVVWIDMESSAYTQRTLDLFERLRASGRENVAVAVQSYLRRTDGDVERLIATRGRVRLTKGAYAEPPELAYPKKADVDAAFRRQMEALLLRGTRPAIATHDDVLIAHAEAFAAARGIDRSRFEFQLLHGIRRDLQERLARDGYTVRSYIPFGEHWYPYYMRRLAERPANVAFILRAIVRER